MAIRHHGRGTLVIERSFGGIKIRRASGTNSPFEFAEIIDTLDSLAKTNRLDLLERLKRKGGLTPLALHRQLKAGVVFQVGTHLPDAHRAPTIDEALEPFLAQMERRERSPRYLRDLRYALNKLKMAAEEHPDICKTVLDLPALFNRVLAPAAESSATPDAFRVLRSTAVALAKWAGKEFDLKTIYPEMLTVEQVRRTKRRREHKPYSPFEAWGWRQMLNIRAEENGFGAVGDVFWLLCVTGMRPSEYWGDVWTVHPHHLTIKGKKTVSATRDIPRLEVEYPKPALTRKDKRGKRAAREECPTRNHAYFAKYLREFQRSQSENLRYTVYDTRRTFAHWMEDAGLPATRRRWYLGHSPRNLTEQYEDKKPTREEIYADALRMRRYISESISDRAEQMDVQTLPLTPITPASRKSP